MLQLGGGKLPLTLFGASSCVTVFAQAAALSISEILLLQLSQFPCAHSFALHPNSHLESSIGTSWTRCRLQKALNHSNILAVPSDPAKR